MNPRQLILMRHATAEAGGGRDHDRRLTTRGRDEALRVGLRLRSLDLTPDHVLSSTALRCRETWQGVSAGLGRSASVDFEKGLYNAGPDGLLHSLAGLAEPVRVLLLAHNPGISVLALELAGGDETAKETLRGGFAPASWACFDIDGPWSLLSSRTARLCSFERVPEG